MSSPRSEEGCLVVSHDETVAVPAFPIDELVDTTGAGDLFAAGFLLAFPVISMPRTCARHGALAAAEVIQHVGARPAVSLKTLAEDNGLPVERPPDPDGPARRIRK